MSKLARAPLLVLILGLGALAGQPRARASGLEIDDEKVTTLQHTEAECGKVRLDEPSGQPPAPGPMTDVPVRDQATLQGCQSYTAAAMVDAYDAMQARLQGKPELGPPARRTAPQGVFLDYVIANKQAKNSDGNISSWISTDATPRAVIDTVLRPAGGGCAEESYTIGRAQIEAINDDFVAARRNYAASKDRSGRDKVTQGLLCQIDGVLRLPPEALDSTDIASALASADQRAYWRKLQAAACTRGPAGVVLPPVTHLTRLHAPKASLADIQKMIDQKLTQPNPQPLGIGYCSSFYQFAPPKTTDPLMLTFQMEHQASANAQAALVDVCGAHASVMMGRQWRNGKCMYLIQNSWGADPSACGNYHVARKADCENGKIWIGEDELDNIFSVDAF